MSDSEFDLSSIQDLVIQHLSELEVQNSMPNPLLTEELRQQRAREQWAETLNEQALHFKTAFSQILALKEQLSEVDKKAAEEGLAIISDLDLTPQEGAAEEREWTANPLYRLQNSLSSRHFQAFFAIFQLLLAQQKWEEAISVLVLLTCLFPGQSTAWLALGRIQQKQGEWQEAIIAYTQANHLQPSHPLPVILLADCHASLGALSEAECYLQHSKRLVEQYPEKGFEYEARINALQSKLRKSA